MVRKGKKKRTYEGRKEKENAGEFKKHNTLGGWKRRKKKKVFCGEPSHVYVFRGGQTRSKKTRSWVLWKIPFRLWERGFRTAS